MTIPTPFYQRLPLIFSCLALGGLAVVPVYASNGAVILLGLGVLAFCHPKFGFQIIKNQLTTIAGAFLIMFLAWMFINLLWIGGGKSETTAALAVMALCIAGLFFMAAMELLDHHQTRTAQTVLIFACAAMIGLFLFEFTTNGVLAKYLKGHAGPNLDFIGRGLAILISIIWPVAILIVKHTGKKAWAAVLFAAAGIAVYLYPNEAMLLGFGIGFVTFAACFRARRIAIVFVFGVFSGLVIFSPIFAQAIVDNPSIKKKAVDILHHRQHRLNIWEFVSSKIEDRPVLGYGFEASRRMGAEEDRYFKETKKIFGEDRLRIKLPLHPHNIPLQIWLELGGIGIFLYLGILFGIGRIIWAWHGPPVWAAALAASTASYLTVSSLSFGAWQSWWLATAWLTAGILVLTRKVFESSGGRKTA